MGNVNPHIARISVQNFESHDFEQMPQFGSFDFFSFRFIESRLADRQYEAENE